MTASARRIEVKAGIGPDALAAVQARLRGAGLSLHPLYPMRVVQSIYFDHADRRLAVDSDEGMSDRTKIRLRWYGEGTSFDTASVEWKLRRGAFGWKRAHLVSGGLEVQGLATTALLALIRRRLPAEVAASLTGAVEPSQWIRYRRQYFGNPGRTLRVTLDHDLRAVDCGRQVLFDWRRGTALGGISVLEVKAGPAEAAAVADLVQVLGITPQRCSKYALACGFRVGFSPMRLEG